MANEILFSNLSGDIRLAAMISQELHLLLRDTGNLRNTPYMQYAGSVNGTGSNVVRMRKIGLYGRDSFTAPGEIAAVANTALTEGHADITASRQSLMYSISDKATMTAFGDSPNEASPFNLAASIAASYDTRFAELTSTSAASFSSDVGGAAAMTVSTFFSAIYQLEQADSFLGAPPPYVAVLHSKALAELQNSLRAETANIISNSPDAAEMVKAKESYAGQLFGVDIYRSSHVNQAVGEYKNYMMGIGALAYADGTPQIIGASETMVMDKVTIEISRTPEQALTSVIGHAYLGCAIVEDARGTLLSSN